MPFPRPVLAVVFDMDGLIFDTERLYAKAMHLAAEDMGAGLTNEAIQSAIGLPSDACDILWAKYFGAGFDLAAFRSVSRANFKSLTETDLRLKSGVEPLLDLLDLLQMPRAIATSTIRPTVDHHLAKTGLTERFHHILAYGDYPEGKPHPAPYLTAARRLGVDPSNCLALEDSHNGVRSAAAAGMMTIMVPDMLDATNEMRELALHVARDLHEVRAMLGGVASGRPTSPD